MLGFFICFIGDVGFPAHLHCP
jgi:hypothetical protein